MKDSQQRHNGSGVPARQPDIIGWQAQMCDIVLEEINGDAMRQVIRAMVAKAKGGDLPAARLILSYAVGSPGRRDPEERGPTPAVAGSNEKIEVLARRRAAGLPLHQNGDGPKRDLS